MAMTLDDVKRELEMMTPEEREQFLTALARDYTGEEGMLERDFTQAEQFGTTPAPDMYRTGRFTTAANPLEFWGNFAQRGTGEHLRRGAMSRAQEMTDERTAATRTLMDILRGGSPTASPQVNDAASVAAQLRKGPY